MRKIILAVEKTASRQEGSIAAALEAAGHEVFQSTSAVVALEILRMLVVDLVVTEVDLPHMDGIEFTRQIRALPRFRQTPVLLLAAKTGLGPEGEVLGRRAGATAWLKHPVSCDHVVNMVGGIFTAQAAIPRPTVGEFNAQPAGMAAVR